MNKQPQELAALLGLQVDGESKALYGRLGGYLVALTNDGQLNQWQAVMSLCENSAPDLNRVKEFAKEVQGVAKSTVTGYRVAFDIKVSVFGGNLNEKIQDALQLLVDVLQCDGYRNCSESDGTEEGVQLYLIDSRLCFLTEEQFQATVDELQNQKQAYDSKPGNLLGGLVGGLLGALIGAAVIVLISQLGYIAVLSGIIMGVLTVKGFELFGGKLNIVSILLLIAIMLGMVYVANRADYALALSSAVEAPILESFRWVEDVVKESGLTGQYWTDFAKQLLFTALGAIPMMISALQSRKKKLQAYVLTREEA